MLRADTLMSMATLRLRSKTSRGPAFHKLGATVSGGSAPLWLEAVADKHLSSLHVRNPGRVTQERREQSISFNGARGSPGTVPNGSRWLRPGLCHRSVISPTHQWPRARHVATR